MAKPSMGPTTESGPPPEGPAGPASVSDISTSSAGSRAILDRLAILEEHARSSNDAAIRVATALGSLKGIEDKSAAIDANLGIARADIKTNFLWMIGVFGAGFLILAGLALTAYLRSDDRFQHLSDRLEAVDKSLVKVDTKLEDLLDRIPPAVNPAPRRH